MSAHELNPKASPKGWRRLHLAACHALDGLRTTLRREAAFRQECIASAALAPVALLTNVTPLEHAVLIATLLAVLIVELLNTGIEAIVDLVSPDHHRLAGVAKDAGAAAVLLALLLTGTVWLIVFLPQG
jgi:diacylglycerol kinase (ATP)